MTKKQVTTNKDHKCAACQEVIPAGSKALYRSGRAPRFDESGEQCGIEYYRVWLHVHDCMAPESCLDGDHEWTKEQEFDHYAGNWRVGTPTGRTICARCGAYKGDAYD